MRRKLQYNVEILRKPDNLLTQHLKKNIPLSHQKIIERG